jgi:solute carrier family 25 thiamine pyrophosphate transporter 19
LIKNKMGKQTKGDDPLTFQGKYPRWHTVVAGAAAGAGARLLTAPLDLIKIRRQLVPTCDRTLLKSWAHIFRTEGGIGALYRGNIAATYLWIGYAAVQFSLYARTSTYIHSFEHLQPVSLSIPPALAAPYTGFQTVMQTIGKNPTAVAFCSGATAGVGATLSTYPFDICRTAFAASGLKNGGASTLTLKVFATDMIKRKGMRGFYAGGASAVVQIIPYMGINFALYDYLERYSEANRQSVGSSGLAGTIAGGVSKLLVYPMDTVKKRLQAQAFSHTASTYKGTIHCFTTILKKEGAASLYKGLVPTVLKSCVGTGFSFACFTLTKNSLEGIYDHRHQTHPTQKQEQSPPKQLSNASIHSS